jgi:hypothetical protein
MLRDYYTAFRASLLRLKATRIPSFEDIQEEVRKRYFYGFVCSVAEMPMILMERPSDEGSGLDTLLDENKSEKVRELAFSGAKYQEAMKHNLRRFDELGVLD